jgi:hypothetical protein
MKKSLLAALIAGILLLSVGAFAGTITVSDIPDIFVADDGNPTGTAGDRDFVFSQPFAFADYVSVSGGSSTNAITVSYVVVDASATIDSALALEIEGVAHPLATSGGETAPVAIGTVAGLDSGADGVAGGILFLEYVNTPALYDTALTYDREVKFIGENGDDDPGSNTTPVNIFLEADGTDRFSGVPPLFIDTFDTDSESWIFTSIMGSSTEASGSGTLDITYNNTMVFSYWLRPIGSCDALSADTLYKAQMDVSSSVASSSAMGDIPDFRVATSLDIGPGQLYFISSFLSDGGSNYISPLSAGRSYEIYFEPTGAATGQTAELAIQFEGYNFPFGGRDDLIGETISLTRAEVDPYPAYDVNAAGTVVCSIADSAGFATGSGSANGWSYNAATAAGNAEATGAVSSDGEGLDITANALGTNSYAYGSWDANPSLAASPVTFTGGQLYRATFVITTDTLPTATENSPIPQVRIQTGDSHMASACNLYSNFGAATNKQLTTDESGDPIDLWFYYPSSRTAGSYNEDKIYPAFEILTVVGYLIPDSASVTLREYELSEQALP